MKLVLSLVLLACLGCATQVQLSNLQKVKTARPCPSHSYEAMVHIYMPNAEWEREPYQPNFVWVTGNPKNSKRVVKIKFKLLKNGAVKFENVQVDGKRLTDVERQVLFLDLCNLKR